MSGLHASIGLFALAWLAVAWPGVGYAAAASPDAVRAAAERAVQARFDLPGNRVVAQALPLDPRLRLASCDQPLRAELPDAVRPAPRLSVPVQCPQAGWAVRVQVQVQLFHHVLVTNRPLQRGDGLDPADVHVEERDLTRLGYGYIDTFDQLTGRSLARALPGGSVLTPAALGGRQTVRAGDHVQVLAQLGDIVVRADGIALGSGDNGARLRVRNESSGKVVDAMVRGPGEVQALP
ncbi:flagellar basal body P-ring formation chaperone FlgA [Rhodanobacter sp. DHB23]|uniref:flagellar basal body P-ring formation chaperone FlgA n=1 Tax=Rhodanobacter sp. DHB23 TaxID=2775923 RepID=UPI001781403D|nr:flagellar basal body P-ring formation chaperone FlgA [Rhodanobacter sp. DHB23]MBD8871229.1 flagellar basal body P-ring formation protein FlgA [Rhodanobacter sp. DHB23]